MCSNRYKVELSGWGGRIKATGAGRTNRLRHGYLQHAFFCRASGHSIALLYGVKNTLPGSERRKAVWGSRRALSIIVERLGALLLVTVGLVDSLRVNNHQPPAR
jgi:hypothetical protein